MEMKSAVPVAGTSRDVIFVWREFEARRRGFWGLIRHSADASDQDLASLPAYNAFLQYGLTVYRTAGAEACRILALALLQGHPAPSRAEAALGRFWAGLLPDSEFRPSSRWH